MFGLFKNKKKELAKEIFGAFKPRSMLLKQLVNGTNPPRLETYLLKMITC